MSDSRSLSMAVSQFRPLVVYEADIQFLAESTEHEKSVCVTPMKRHRFLHSAAVFTPEGQDNGSQHRGTPPFSRGWL